MCTAHYRRLWHTLAYVSGRLYGFGGMEITHYGLAATDTDTLEHFNINMDGTQNKRGIWVRPVLK